MRIGQGFDVHALVAGRKLMIGGVEIPHHKGLRRPFRRRRAAARDLRRAARRRRRWATSARTIPTPIPQYAGVDSRVLLRDVAQKLRAQKLKVVNIDATIVAEAPRMAPHMARMIGNIAADLGIEPAAVNIKATTTEKLGFVGRGEGIAAQAIALHRLSMYSPPLQPHRGPRRAARLHARQQLRRCWSPAPAACCMPRTCR